MQPGTKGDTGERPAVILREQFPTHRARVLYSSREIIFSSGTDSGNVARSPNSYHVDVDDEGDVVRRYTCHQATRSTRSNLVVMCSTFHVFRPIMPVSPRGLRESWSNSVPNVLPSSLSFLVVWPFVYFYRQDSRISFFLYDHKVYLTRNDVEFYSIQNDANFYSGRNE